jgi:hypothetical protein
MNTSLEHLPPHKREQIQAIAHGLESEFWLEGAGGTWKPRPMPLIPIDEPIRKRSSPAVEAALQSLLEAPTPAAQRRSPPEDEARDDCS